MLYSLEDNFFIAAEHERLEELYNLIMNAQSIDDIAENFNLDDVIPYYKLEDLKKEAKFLYEEIK
jgi:DNA-binding ferritin-like protein